MVDKFKFFSLRSPDAHFVIYEKDLADETIKQKDICIGDCKTGEERNNKLNPIFTEVIARILENAKPRILEDQVVIILDFKDLKYENLFPLNGI